LLREWVEEDGKVKMEFLAPILIAISKFNTFQLKTALLDIPIILEAINHVKFLRVNNYKLKKEENI
jgi:hypothetical protein